MKLKTHLHVCLVAIALIYSGCQAKSDDIIVGKSLNLSKLAQSLSTVAAGSGKTPLVSSPNEAPRTRDELGDMKTVVQVYDSSNIGNLTVPGFGSLKLGKDEKNLNVYYIESKVVVNGNHKLITRILQEENEDTQAQLSKQAFDLALLSQGLLTGAELTEFVNRSVNLI